MLLEREGLLASLDDRVAAARGGNGSLALVAGEAGAGKTSVVKAFVDSLGNDAIVISGACDPLATPRPLSPLHDFVADPDSGLADLAPGTRPAMELFGEVLARLQTTIRPIVMVIEDIHWADEGTLDFIRFMGRRVSGSKALLICTYRDDEIGVGHALRPVLGQLMSLSSTERLQVQPLSLEAVEELAHDYEIDAAKLHHRTDGNAFFVTEVLAAGSAVPTAVQDAVLARMTNLGTEARRAIEGVSIAPRNLHIDATMSLVEVSAAPIDEAVSSGMLVEDRGELRFRHELARAAVEASILPARRLHLHQRMIEMLEQEPRRDTARLAHHAIRTGSPDLIVRYAPEAGHVAARRGARREAVSFYQAALDHSDSMDDDKVAGLRVRTGDELRVMDRPDESAHELGLAIEHYRTTGQSVPLANALGLLYSSLWNLKRFDEGWDALDEALGLLRPLGPSEALGTTLYRIAHNHMLARHARPAFESIAEAEKVAVAIGSEVVGWQALMMRGCINIVVGDAETGIELLDQAAVEAVRLGNPRFLSIALGMLGSGGGEARRYEAAIPALERGVEQGLATDEDYSVVYNRSWLARVAFEQGRWDDAVDYTELVARTTLQDEGIAWITAMSALGRIRVRRGDPGGIGLLDEMADLARHHELQHGWNAICGRAEHFWLMGRPEEALAQLEPAYERAVATDSEWARGEIGFWMWRAGVIDVPPPLAADPFALQMSGRWEEAAGLWETIGCPYERAMALADGSEEAKLAALEVLDALGARPLADRVRRELRLLGVESVPRGPSRRTLANPWNLTSRQLEVLHLIAEGAGNGRIAEELYISKKTVEHHVSAIYGKLGVTSRPEAMLKAADSGIVEK